ncbi:MAG TPA: tetratricopeptide repeat protein [Candidatus Nitrosopolaris sp.]|nr:tetratricopeptide repeat protein [Candidatus Nitrosopolaris sp.]
MQPQPQEHSITLPLVSKTEENVCLPLVINVVSKYWGEEIQMEEAMEVAKKYPGMKGSIMMEGIDLAEKHGFASFIYRGSIKDLKKRIDQGIPPIVILPGIHETVQHATIASGYDSEERRILTYVPEPDTIGAIPESKFEQDWEQDDMITLVLVPSDMKDLFKDENFRFSKSNRICFEAEKLRQQGKINEAIAELRSAVKLDNDNPQAWCLLAGIYNETNAKEAVSCYEKTIALNAKYYLAYRGLGNYYLKNKDYNKAEEYYTKAISINPYRFGPIYKNRALARIQLENNSGAKEDLLKYIEQTPNALDKNSIEDAISQL